MVDKNPEPNLNILNNDIHIEFEPNSLPNVIVHHMPEMSFLSFICCFGGLLGMLLGTSLLEILTHLWLLTKQVFVKLISINIFNQISNYENNNTIIFIKSGIKPGIRPKYMSGKMSGKYVWK